MSTVPATVPPDTLHRQLGVAGATLLGLGSIVGTGVFVSLALAAGAAGSGVLAAVALAAGVAACNGLSSAQLAASHPKSGGTYEYGYRYLSPLWGFSAGWMFLCAKTASAATAAQGFAGYLLAAARTPGDAGIAAVAIGAVALLTALALGGVRSSNRVNAVIVTTTLLTLIVLILAGVLRSLGWPPASAAPRSLAAAGSAAATPTAQNVLYASALMFVAYTGYGRIATLGEEVVEPRRSIPVAILLTLGVSMALYLGVAWVCVQTVSPALLAQAAEQTAAPLELVAESLGMPGGRALVAIGATAAMLSVLLNLVLGLSRVLLAMGRRGDMPAAFGRLNAARTAPPWSVVAVGLLIAAVVLLGGIKATWSFSALTVLVYYAITNLAALRLPREDRRFPALFAWGGLASCLFLAFWVDQRTWLLGASMLGAGWVWFGVRRLRRQRSAGAS